MCRNATSGAVLLKGTVDAGVEHTLVANGIVPGIIPASAKMMPQLVIGGQVQLSANQD